jgi:pyridoxal phosphate enzyme (YggS family)
MDISDNIEKINDKIKSAAAQAGRSLEEIKLIAVSKKKSTDLIAAAHHCGLTNFGENYLQESVEKISSINSKEIDWHFIGNIQSKKSLQIAQYFSWVHTIDRAKIVNALDAAGKNLKVLIQVNVSEEKSKSGISENELMPLADIVIESKCLELKGLMALPSAPVDGKINEKEYEKMNMLSDQLKNYYSPADEISLGTSQDFELGIKHGSTMIRVGESIFGKR